MILAQQSGILIYLVRVLFTVIDRVVYWALMEVYNLIDQISRVNIFGEGTLNEFGERIYAIIGVLMLFKLAFSIINYIVDPDKLEDSKKGFAGIVKNIIIMLALIVTVPLIFKYAMALQYVVVSDDTIGRLITGREGATNTNVGDNMAVALLSGFIHPDHGLEGCSQSENHEYHEAGGKNKCEESLEKYHLAQTYHDAYFSEKGYNYLLSLALSAETMGDGNYVIVYNVLLSTIVGAFTTWILLMFCIDLAVRIIKLGFLQLIAPIPIVTYMDDGGQGVFKKWVNVCTKTYADLFIRLAAINFAIYIISTVLISSEGNNTLTGNFKICEWTFNDSGTLTADCSKQAGFFVKLFLILGTLMFAKQLPKMIEEITGLKLDGGFTMNPMKKLQEVPLIGNAAAKGLGLAGRTAKNLGGLGLGLAGIGAKAAGGAIVGSKAGQLVGTGLSKGKTWFMGTDAYNKATALKGTASDFMNKVGSTKGGRMASGTFDSIAADVGGTLGGGWYAKKIDKQVAALKRVADFKSALKSQADYDTRNHDFTYNGQTYNGNTKALKQKYDDLVNSGTATADQITAAREMWENSQQWSITNASGGNGIERNAQLEAMKTNMSSIISDNSNLVGEFEWTDKAGNVHHIADVDKDADYDMINGAVIAAQNAQVDLTNNERYSRSKNALDASSNKKK